MRNAKKGFYWGETGRETRKSVKNMGKEARGSVKSCELKLLLRQTCLS